MHNIEESSRAIVTGATTTTIGPLAASEVVDLALRLAPLELLTRYQTRPDDLAAALARAIDRGDDVLCARERGVPLGLSWVVPEGAFARAAYLRLLAVGEEAQGRGIGARLLKASEDRHAAGSSHLLLLASGFNADAHRFYRKMGYEHVGVLPGFVLPGVDEWIFVKRLGV